MISPKFGIWNPLFQHEKTFHSANLDIAFAPKRYKKGVHHGQNQYFSSMFHLLSHSLFIGTAGHCSRLRICRLYTLVEESYRSPRNWELSQALIRSTQNEHKKLATSSTPCFGTFHQDMYSGANFRHSKKKNYALTPSHGRKRAFIHDKRPQDRFGKVCPSCHK